MKNISLGFAIYYDAAQHYKFPDLLCNLHVRLTVGEHDVRLVTTIVTSLVYCLWRYANR